MPRAYKRSKAYDSAIRLLRKGYRLAYDPIYKPPFGPRSKHPDRRGIWWLTCGKGAILKVGDSVAEALQRDGEVREWLRTKDITYWGLTDGSATTA